MGHDLAFFSRSREYQMSASNYGSLGEHSDDELKAALVYDVLNMWRTELGSEWRTVFCHDLRFYSTDSFGGISY